MVHKGRRYPLRRSLDPLVADCFYPQWLAVEYDWRTTLWGGPWASIGPSSVRLSNVGQYVAGIPYTYWIGTEIVYELFVPHLLTIYLLWFYTRDPNPLYWTWAVLLDTLPQASMATSADFRSGNLNATAWVPCDAYTYGYGASAKLFPHPASNVYISAVGWAATPPPATPEPPYFVSDPAAMVPAADPSFAALPSFLKAGGYTRDFIRHRSAGKELQAEMVRRAKNRDFRPVVP